jgi:hypothetical protein
LKITHCLSKSKLAFAICSIAFLTLAGNKSYAQDIPANNTPNDKKMRITLKGLMIGEETRILPYASLESGFDPYFGLKLEHSAFGNTKDRMFHHLKFESLQEYSWKFRYQANSISSQKTKYSFLFKIKSDDDEYFYGIGNSSVKSLRAKATYFSVFAGGELETRLSEDVVFRLSSGMWKFKTGLAGGSEFERASDAMYFTSRLTFSDSKSIDYWKPSLDNQWSAYVEFGVPVNLSVESYARINFESITRFPVFKSSKFSIGTRFEFLLSPDRELVPYFALPEIGSNSGLRGFSSKRFRDFALMAVNLEFSFPLSRRVDGFFLTDVAQTASDPTKLFHSNFRRNIGFGIRFLRGSHPISFGIAGGNEGVKLFSSIALGRVW